MRTLILSLLLCVATAVLGRVGYYSDPTVAGERLVFSAEGDLWLADLSGGTANRLTSHVEEESQPALSSDGSQLAFLARYDQGTEVYVMDVAGGVPRRLTFGGEVVGLEGWTQDGRILVVAQSHRGPIRETVVRALDPESLMSFEWPLAGANQASLMKKDTLFFTLYGLHRTGDHARIYRGGAMAQLWKYAQGEDEAVRLLQDINANLKHPMWTAGRLYFLSDADGFFNIWSVTADGSDLQQHTHVDGWDVRNPAASSDHIVYQVGADLFAMTLKTGVSDSIAVDIRSDFDGKRTRWIDNPLEFTSAMRLGGDAESVTATVRGSAARLGLLKTRRVLVGAAEDERIRQAIEGPKGKWIYAIVGDETRDEIVRFDVQGGADRETLTKNGEIFRWTLLPSPNGRYLAHTDKRGRLWIMDLESQADRLVDEDPENDQPFGDMTWSVDGQLLAYSRFDSQARVSRVALYDVESGQREVLTTDRFPSRSPAFSADRKWLYFLSDRRFNATPGAPWGDRNMGPQFDRRGEVYALALDPTARFPFLHDALGPLAEDEESNELPDEDTDAADAADMPVPLIWNGLSERLYKVPVAPGNYSRLEAAETHLFMLDAPQYADPALKSVAVDSDAKVETFASNVTDYGLSNDRKKLYYRSGDNAFIVDAAAKAPDDLSKLTVNTAGWRLPVDPDREWQQMFDDAWRMHRDFAFHRELRGLDWEAVREKYAPLVSRVGARHELDDLLGEMISELGILHSQVGGSEQPVDDEKSGQGALGGSYEAVDGGLKIVNVLRGDPDLLEERVPLALPEAGIRVGDVIEHINFRSVTTPQDLAAALAGQAGQPVVIGYVREKESRIARVLAIDASELPRRRYRHWEQVSRDRVDQSSDGRVGYLHLYAMGGGDIADFAREWFPLAQRDAVIIDVRSNRGGNVDAWVINALMRKVWAFWQVPGAQASSFENMQQAFRGHLVVLIDEFTYSDGETFAAGVKSLGLATLIGTQTAGAGIWLSDRNRLADNGIARIAEFAQYDVDGRWLIEGRGVSPDLVVRNPPHAVASGKDPQLDAAIDYLLRRVEEAPVSPLQARPIPPVGTPGGDVTP